LKSKNKIFASKIEDEDAEIPTKEKKDNIYTK